MNPKSLALLVATSLLMGCSTKEITTDTVRWSDFLGQHDMVWNMIPSNYYAGAILGNGLLGANIYRAKDPNTYRWDIGRVDVTEGRKDGDVLFDKARLPIGHFSLTTKGSVESETMHLSLWDATAKGKLTTTEGSIGFTTYVHALDNIICVDMETEGNESVDNWKWNPEEAISPRSKFEYARPGMPADYGPNPDLKMSEKDGLHLAIQNLIGGMTYVVGWTTQQHKNKESIWITVAYEQGEENAIAAAKEALSAFQKKNAAKAYTEHKDWWHGFYPMSYATFGDKRADSFYWIQEYKLASITRPDKYIIDLQGPWTNATPWPAIWWNLNIQLTYSPLFTANRLEFSEPLWRALNEHKENLINNVVQEEWRVDAAGIGRSSSYDLKSPMRPDLVEQNQYEVGNLTWILFYYYQYCMYKGDDVELITRFYPLLKRSIAYYEHILYKGEDDLWHLPITASPEYAPAADCNYDLALLKWGVQTLLDINEKHSLNDSKASTWLNIDKNLTSYPADEDGFLIGKDVKLTYSHRHYSHLMMIYPLQLISWDDTENQSIITRSINHWLGLKGALQGYTFTGAASMYALQGEGDQAFDNLNQLFEKYIQPNTLYRESGPVIETPFSAVTSLQELYLQSSASHIRVFPAVPSAWGKASFINWRAFGGILVSAMRESYATQFIQLEATASQSFQLHTDLADSEWSIEVVKGGKPSVEKTGRNTLDIHLNSGDIIQLKKTGYEVPLDWTLIHSDSKTYYGVDKP